MSANFTPVFDQYSGQKPFKYWCQTVLPLVYDDALSYYELLNKVVYYLNNVINDITEVEGNTDALLTAYNQLQNYVNTYFDNLDVQEEINNKLDTMATDGTLTYLIEPLVRSAVQNGLPIEVSHQIDNVVAHQIGPTVASQIVPVVEDAVAPIASPVTTAWLNENVTPVGSAVVVDSSLSITGAAADAKATGDAISAANTDIIEIANYLEYRYEEVKPVWTDGSYYHYQRRYNASNAVIEDANSSHVVINVSKGDKYIVRGISYYNINPAILYNLDGTIRNAYPGESLQTLTVSQGVINVEEDGILVVNAYIRQTTNGMSGYTAIYKAASIKEKDTKFNGKTVLFSGDSITNGYGWDYNETVSNRKVICLTKPPQGDYYNLGWVQTFAEDHRGATVYGYGANGTRISQTTGTNSITQRIGFMNDTADYVIFSGGINDCFNHVTLGSMVSTDAGNNAWKTATFNTSTYCGALETLFRNAYNKWTNAKIGFIITGKNTNCMKTELFETTQDDFVRATIEICNKWSVPYLDLYHDDGLCTALTATTEYWFANDQTHPNEKCYREKLRYLVENFMQKL